MKFSDGVDEEDFYALLAVGPLASEAELKRARRAEAKRWHPDHNAGEEAQLRMAAINRAFRTLSDPASRGKYDARLRSGEDELSAAVRQRFRTGAAGTSEAASDPTRCANGDKAEPAGTVRLVSYLRGQGFSVVDNRRRGGVLWVIAKPGVEQVVADLKGRGLEFEYASTGGMATDNRPAWWTRAWG